MKIYKFDKLIKEAMKDVELPNTFNSSVGSCKLAALILTKKLLRLDRHDFKVIEGYITFPTVDWKDAHTWIEMDDGKIIDPTSVQWGMNNIVYLRYNKKEYSPEEYLDLADKYPEEERFLKRYLGSYEYLGTCISTVDDSCIWDATEMAQIIDNSVQFDIEGIYPFLSDELKNKIKNNPQEIESGINDNIVWVYDIKSDIHYFYRKS